MKRLFACLLILCLFATAAIAEDVSSMTDDDLKALYKTVKEELMNRKLWDESTLPAGVYMAGKGLPEGTYECTLKDDGVAIAWRDYDSYLMHKNRVSYIILDEGDMFTLSLYGSVVWELEFNSTVRPFVGLSW